MRPAAITSVKGTNGLQPDVRASHGTSTRAYGLTNTPAAIAAPAASPRRRCTAITAPISSNPTGKLNWPNASSLTKNLPVRRTVSQTSTFDETRRSGRAMSDRCTNAAAIAAVSANQTTSPTGLGTHVKGTMNWANAGKYLYW